jgi:hypothetical protein
MTYLWRKMCIVLGRFVCASSLNRLSPQSRVGMPPPTFYRLSAEWNETTDVPVSANVTVTTDFADPSDGPTLSATADTSGDVSVTGLVERGPWSATLWATPSQFHPWVSYVLPQKKAAAAPGAIAPPKHTVSGGLAAGRGVLALEYSLWHPTFNSRVTVEPDCKGMPASGFLTVAACENVDVGATFKYDPIRSGLLDYKLGCRYVLPPKFKNAVASTYLDAAGKASLIVFGKGTTVNNTPIQGGIAIRDNASEVSVGATIFSPCGRKITNLFDLFPRFDWKLSVFSRINDDWRVAVSVRPLAFTGEGPSGAIGATLTRN